MIVASGRRCYHVGVRGLAIIVALGVLVAPVRASAASPPTPNRVLLISLDGFAASYLADPRLRLPNLRRLAQTGVQGASLTVLPSVTWPAHTTIITGVLPRSHGVVGNHWLDRATRRVVHAWEPSKADSILVPTIFDVAKQAGYTTAALSWPQTNGAATLDLEIPEVYSAQAFKRWTTPKLRSELRAAGTRIDRIVQWAKSEDFGLDRLIADAAEHVIAVHDPGLLLVHFTSGDSRGHRAGPMSPRHRAGLEAYDEYVGRLLTALSVSGVEGETVVVVVSDHGFFEIVAAVDAKKLLVRGGLKPKEVTVVDNGHLTYVYVRGGEGREERVATAKAALEASPAVERVMVVTEYHAAGLPTPSENPAVGDLVAMTKPDHAFRAVKGSGVTGPYPYRATHGYSPEHPQNRPVFIAAGPGVARQRRDVRIRNVDIAPTLAYILGVPMPSATDGRVLREILVP